MDEDERVTVVGNVGQGLRRKATSRGEVLEFSVAHNPRIKTADGSWVDGETTWYRVSAWGKLADNAGASLAKGQPVIVHGILRRPEWTAQDGTTHHGLDITASAIGHDLNKGPARFGEKKESVASAASEPVLVGAPAADEWSPPFAVPAPRAQPPAPVGWTAGPAPEADAPF